MGQGGPSGQVPKTIQTQNGPISVAEFQRLKQLHREDPSLHPDPTNLLGEPNTGYVSVKSVGSAPIRWETRGGNKRFDPGGPEGLHPEEEQLPDGASWSSSIRVGVNGVTSNFTVNERHVAPDGQPQR